MVDLKPKNIENRRLRAGVSKTWVLSSSLGVAAAAMAMAMAMADEEASSSLALYSLH